MPLRCGEGAATLRRGCRYPAARVPLPCREGAASLPPPIRDGAASLPLASRFCRVDATRCTCCPLISAYEIGRPSNPLSLLTHFLSYFTRCALSTTVPAGVSFRWLPGTFGSARRHLSLLNLLSELTIGLLLAVCMYRLLLGLFAVLASSADRARLERAR